MAIDRENWLRSVVPAGTVIAFAGATPPSGWLLCDGSAISRSTYLALFTAISTAHGSGDGSTTFKLPDYRGRFLRGVDGTAGNDPDKASRTAAATGGNTGDDVGSVQGDGNKSHGHGFLGSGGSSTTSTVVWANPQINVANAGAIYANNVTISGGNESRPKNSNVNYIIKA